MDARAVKNDIALMNQTGPITITAQKPRSPPNDPTTEKGRRVTTIEARPIIDDGKSDLMENSTTGTRWVEHQRNVIHRRGGKQSVSPDKYTINENLVVNLADPIRKPDMAQRMN